MKHIFPLCLTLLLTAYDFKVVAQCSVSVNASTTTACSGQSFILTAIASGCGTGLQYQWSTGHVGPSLTTSVINQTTGNIIVAYTVTVTGSSGSAVASRSITIRPEPTFSLFNYKPSICDGDTTFLLMQSQVAGVQYNYTVVQNGVTGANSGTGAVIKQKLSLSGASNGDAVYTVTPRIGSCYGNPQLAQVGVKIQPQVMASVSDTTICSGHAVMITLSSNDPNAGFQWTSSGPAVTGHSNGTGSSIFQALTNIASSQSDVVYNVRATSNNCMSDTLNLTVHVNPPLQVFTSSPGPTICSNEQTQISLNSQPPGASFTWTVTQQNASGASAGSGSIIQQTLHSSSVTAKAIYHIQAFDSLCTSEIKNDTVFITPRPDISYFPPYPSICSGTSVHVNLSSLYPNSFFEYEPLSSNVTGGYAGSGSLISQPLVNSLTVTDTLVYVARSMLNGCTGDSVYIPVAVKPIPQLTMNPDSVTICSGNLAVISILSDLSSTSVSWTTQAQNVNGHFNGNGNLISQWLSTSAPQGTVSYIATGMADGCISDPASAHVTVNACLSIHEPVHSGTELYISKGILHIYLPEGRNNLIRLMDNLGRMVIQEMNPGRYVTFDLSDLKSGIYFLRTHTEKGVKTKRLRIENP